MKTILLSSIAGIALLTGCATHHDQGAAADTDRNVLTGGPVAGTLLADIPQPIKDTIKKKADTGEIAAIVKVKRDGRTVYEVVFTQPDRFPKLWIAEDGTLLSEKNKLE